MTEETIITEEKLAEVRSRFELPEIKAVRVAVGDDDSWALADKIAIVEAETNRLFGIHSSNYRYVPHEAGIIAVEEIASRHIDRLGPFETTVQRYKDGQRLRAQVRFPEKEIKIISNGTADIVNPTIEYFNSYDGGWAEKLLFGAFRLVCSNGLVIGEKFSHERIIHVGTRPEFFSNLDATMNVFNDQANVWKHWHSIKPTKSQIANAILLFSEKQQEEIKQEVASEKPSLWLFYNIITAMITHKVKSLNARVRLENHLRRTTSTWSQAA